MDCSPPGSSVLGILQVRILEWVAIPFSRGSSPPRDQTQVSCIAGRFFTVWASRSPIRKGLCKYQSLVCRWRQGHPFFIATEWHMKADKLFCIMTEAYTCKGSFLPTVCLKTPLMPPNTHTHTYTVWFKSEQLCEVSIFSEQLQERWWKDCQRSHVPQFTPTLQPTPPMSGNFLIAKGKRKVKEARPFLDRKNKPKQQTSKKILHLRKAEILPTS